jgi:cytochrome c
MSSSINKNVLVPALTGVLAAAAAGLGAETEVSQDIPRLMEDKRCELCHHRSERLVGPPYEMIASLHAGKEGIEEKLVNKIINGGGGTWGAMPMPANNHVTEAEARAMVKWILELK